MQSFIYSARSRWHSARPRAWLSLATVSATALFISIGCVSRTVSVESSPNRAAVYVDGLERGQTPFSQRLQWERDDTSHRITLQATDHESVETVLSRQAAQVAPNPWKLDVTLPRLAEVLDVRVESDPSGAAVFVNESDYSRTPVTVPIRYLRSSSKSAWGTVALRVELEDYLPERRSLSYDEAQHARVNVSLTEVRRRLPVNVITNVEGAEFTVNEASVGQVPLQYAFLFTRKDAKSPWSTFLVSVRKDGFRWRRPQGPISPGDTSPFTTSLTLEQALSGELKVELEPIRFVRTRLRTFGFSGEGVAVEESLVLSQVDEIETEPMVRSVTRMTDMVPGEFMLTRLWVAPPEQQLAYSISFRRPEFKDPLANLWRQAGQGVTRLTDGPTIDVEACVSADGQFVYFAANRLRPDKVNLWRVRTTGQGGFTKLTDSPSSVTDTEPAVSPDGTRIAFTSYLREAKAPQIWVTNADGTLPTQIRIGRSSAWSPDGTKLAYVAPDDAGHGQIWVMNADGSKPTQLTVGDHSYEYPIWTPDGSRIVYASNQALNEEGVPNFDIWSMRTDGTERTQLTVNGSHDTRPAVSPDGKYVYFISNRGAKKEFNDNWQIWRMELSGP